MDLTDSTVLVTGGSGFLGTTLCNQLSEHGVTDLITPRSSEYDLTVQADVERLFEETRPEIVIHLAADVGGIGANRENPGRFFYANMAMGLHTIEAARRFETQKFVQVGTICAYPKFAPVPFHEDSLWNGYPEETNAPYGIAKKALLTMLQAYRDQYDMCGIYVLPVNLYGPGDNFDPATSHVIPAMIHKFVEARDEGAPEVVLWGTGSPTREFLYVDDCAEGIVLAAEEYDDREPVNLGTGQEITIRELAETISSLIGYEGDIVWDKTKPDGQPRRCLDTTRAEEQFGFVAQTSLLEGLGRAIGWFEENC